MLIWFVLVMSFIQRKINENHSENVPNKFLYQEKICLYVHKTVKILHVYSCFEKKLLRSFYL